MSNFTLQTFTLEGNDFNGVIGTYVNIKGRTNEKTFNNYMSLGYYKMTFRWKHIEIKKWDYRRF